MGKLRIFKKEDWFGIEDPIEAGPVDPAGLSLAERGVAVTYEHDGKIEGCGGVVLYDDGNGELWIRVSQKVHPMKAVRIIRDAFGIIKEVFPDVKLWCRVREGFEKGRRLIEWLRFQFESLQDGYEVYTWRRHF